MILSLCGFMGAGKSTVAKQLSYQLGCRLIDMDSHIVSMTGESIPEIFAQRGERAFRELERRAAEEISAKYNTPSEKRLDPDGNEYVTLVLSLGGGALTWAETAKIISNSTRCVYLKCSPELLLQRLLNGRSERPLIKGKTKEELYEYIKETLSIREPAYSQASSITVQCDGKNLREICQEIMERI